MGVAVGVHLEASASVDRARTRVERCSVFGSVEQLSENNLNATPKRIQLLHNMPSSTYNGLKNKDESLQTENITLPDFLFTSCFILL